MPRDRHAFIVTAVELVQALLALLTGFACALLLLWVTARFFGLNIIAEISLSDRPGEALATVLIILTLLIPVLFFSLGLSLVAVRPLLGASDYERVVRKVLGSPMYEPLRRFLLRSKPQG